VSRTILTGWPGHCLYSLDIHSGNIDPSGQVVIHVTACSSNVCRWQPIIVDL
jgi:hypothetical protein